MMFGDSGSFSNGQAMSNGNSKSVKMFNNSGCVGRGAILEPFYWKYLNGIQDAA